MQANRRDGITFNLSRLAPLPAPMVKEFEDHDRHFEGLRATIYVPNVASLKVVASTPSGMPYKYGVQEYALKLLSCVIGNGAASITHATAATDNLAATHLIVSLKSVLHENPTGQILITPAYAYPVKGFASTIKQRYYLYWTKS